MNTHEPRGRAYDPIAFEYYDPSRHPTCANFGELSEKFIAPRLLRMPPDVRILDVGAGRSVAAAVLAGAKRPLSRLVILDSSPAMLAHSGEWLAQGARGVVADARETGLGDETFDVVVSSLGDPYNQPSFWRETVRLLPPGGRCFFTTPAHEWAVKFRAGSDLASAEFTVRNGNVLQVPSYTLPAEAQIAMVRDFGLKVVETKEFSRSDLRRPVSPKLEVDGGDASVPVVRGYAIEKPAPE